jgi:hypothetical protein
MAITAKSEPTKTAPQAAEVNLEMFKIQRYMYNGTLYEKGSVYVFSAEDAKVMLCLTDPAGLPVFGPAKPRTKLVQIPQEMQKVAVRPVPNQLSEPSDGRKVAPVGKLELGDDDPEIVAKLASADANGPQEIAVVV